MKKVKRKAKPVTRADLTKLNSQLCYLFGALPLRSSPPQCEPDLTGLVLLPVTILVSETENNGGMVQFPDGRKIILSKADAAALRQPTSVKGVRIANSQLMWALSLIDRVSRLEDRASMTPFGETRHGTIPKDDTASAPEPGEEPRVAAP